MTFTAFLAAALSFCISSYAASNVIYQQKKADNAQTSDGTVISKATEAADEQISDDSRTIDRSRVIVSKGILYDTAKNDSGNGSGTDASAGNDKASDATDGKNSSSDNAAPKDASTSASTEAKAADNSIQTGTSAEVQNNAAQTAATEDGSLIKNGRFSILQTECYDNLDEAPVLSGGEVRFLANKGSAAQQLSAVFKSSDGSVIVVDGGQKADAEHLISVIKEMGGRVDAWLITHPQTDHVGALNYILESGRTDISIDGIYYSFPEQAWYDANDPDECGMVRTLRKNLSAIDPAKLHSDMKAGSGAVLSDKLSFKALNEPQLTTGIFAGNSSGIMYDIAIDGKHFIILGDMAAETGDKLMEAGALDGIVCDYVQISHHGQTGVSNAFYNRLNPSNCIWPTNEYIYYAEGVNNSGLGTTLTKMCISKLRVKRNFVTLGRDVIIK